MREKVYITAEIGINHNGDIEIAKKLIDVAFVAGCDAVKFQKRTIDKVYTKEFLDGPRQSPWGTTQRAQKEGLEFGKNEYDIIDAYCKEKGLEWYASAWDVDSQIFLRQYNLKFNKIASAMLVNEDLLDCVASEGRYTFIATGMSSMEEVDRAVEVFKKHNCPFELLHCNSTYPMPDEDANLNLIHTLAQRYGCKVGYSGHEDGLLVSECAVAIGATSIERHITLDRTMYGSDQKASVEPAGLCELVKNIRIIERLMGDGEKRLTPAEAEIKKKLRG
ncbi:MAG: N-acetylneuraminate synthase [Lachnospiraceae bacterium]|jgi:N-acetylneuraminate synthase|nr:N-acetylneuraminate synthase [Lachnospiraceae bacterium]